jgi:DNA-binding NtrC family response regulator
VGVLDQLGFETRGSIDPHQALAEITADPQSFIAVVIDYTIAGIRFRDFITALENVRPDIPVIVTNSKKSHPEEADALVGAIRLIESYDMSQLVAALETAEA